MKSFILAILDNWHVFSQTKLVTIFRNILILYNKKLLATTSFEDIQKLYGLVSLTSSSVFNLLQLYNDLDYVNNSTNIVYLHKCNINKKQYNQFIETNIDESNTVEYTYEEAFNKLQEFENNALMKDTAGDAGSESDETEEDAQPTMNRTEFNTIMKEALGE